MIEHVNAAFVAPRALRPGAVIAIVAPSSPFPVEDFQAGVERLGSRYQLRYGQELLSRKGFLAGDDTRRSAELRRAIEDPEVDAIVAARGGYGTTRILETIDVARVAAARKLLVGFSDLTALHALWQRAGLRSIHGQMIAALGRCGPPLVERWIATVEGAPSPPLAGLRAIRGGVAEGPLVGGNLAVLAALVGTPYAPPLDGAILFLEDVGERPYRVDRMLTALRHAGWLARLRGIVLGAFTDAAPGPDGATIDEVLADRCGDLGIPVLAGIPAGHLEDNLELPFGAPVRIDADAGRLDFLEPAVAR